MVVFEFGLIVKLITVLACVIGTLVYDNMPNPKHILFLDCFINKFFYFKKKFNIIFS
jgi:hypothetical protein